MTEIAGPKYFLRRTVAPLLAVGGLLTACAGEVNHNVQAVSSKRIEQTGYAGLVALIGEIEQYKAPIITNWNACPKGDSTLPVGTNVNAFSLPVASNSSPTTYTEIGTKLTIIPSEKIQSGFIGDQDGEDDTAPTTQVEVYEHDGEAVAWCGPSIGMYVELGILGPNEGTIAVIPNIKGIDPVVYAVG